MITKEQIAELANEKLQGTDLFLVDIKVLPSNKIRFMWMAIMELELTIA